MATWRRFLFLCARLIRPLVWRESRGGVGWAGGDAAEGEILFSANPSGDNPLVVTDTRSLATQGAQVGRYIVPGVPNAAIVPTANFESLSLVAALERVALALGHSSESITQSV